MPGVPSGMSVMKEDGADVYTLDEFREAVRCGSFNEYDGSAYYGGDPATNEDDAGIPVDMSVITPFAGHSHVWWYNK